MLLIKKINNQYIQVFNLVQLPDFDAGDFLKMKNKYRELIKKIIGPEAEKRGFTYSCSGALNFTKPLAIYTKKDENLTLMIYIYQSRLDETQFVFDCGNMLQQKKYKCETLGEFEDAVKEVNAYLIEERYSEMDRYLESPFRVRIKDDEKLRDEFNELVERFEEKYPVDESWNVLDMLKYLDRCYEDADKYQGDELREFLFEIAAEYGKTLLKLPHMKLEWSDDNRLFVKSKDSSVVMRLIHILDFIFSVRGNNHKPNFADQYPMLLNYIDREKIYEELENRRCEIVKEIIGFEAEKRGFTYSCLDDAPLKKTLVAYSRTHENQTQTISVYHNKVMTNMYGFICDKICEDKVFGGTKLEDFEKNIKKINEYLLSTGYDELDKVLNS